MAPSPPVISIQYPRRSGMTESKLLDDFQEGSSQAVDGDLAVIVVGEVNAPAFAVDRDAGDRKRRFQDCGLDSPVCQQFIDGAIGVGKIDICGGIGS